MTRSSDYSCQNLPFSHEEMLKQSFTLDQYKQHLLVEKYKRKLSGLNHNQKEALLQHLQQREKKNCCTNQSGNFINLSNENEILKNETRQNFDQNQNYHSKEDFSFIESMKQMSVEDALQKMSVEDTLQKRTLLKQESIRQTLSATNVVNNSIKSNVKPVQEDEEQINNPKDFSMSDMLADPRWNGTRSIFNGNLSDRLDYMQRVGGNSLMIFIFHFVYERIIFLKIKLNTLDRNEALYTWSGHLPPKIYKNPIYSNKVFLGGVPWDITEGSLSDFRTTKLLKLVFLLLYPKSFSVYMNNCNKAMF